MKLSNLLLGTAMACALAVPSHAGPIGPGIKHIVVIYQENHSFDNLYGNWGNVGTNSTNGRANATAAKTTQMNQSGAAFTCLKQLDVNLTSPPLAGSCTDTTTGTSFTSNFPNAPFAIQDSIPTSAKTCPPPGVFATNGLAAGTGDSGGCTRDIYHRFYNEQFQLDGGKQDRYVLGSDASGLAMGYYDSTSLPIYAYLHGDSAPHYVIGDNFYQGAFGGSFLNHQWLIAAAAPHFGGALNDGSANDLHSVLNSNLMPTSTPLYTAGPGVGDRQLTTSCSPAAGRGATPPGVVCGDYAVNTTQPWYQPYSPGTADAKRLQPLTNTTIGDELSAAGIDWAWFSGGWSNANGDVGKPGWTNGNRKQGCTDPQVLATATWPNCPDKNFQFHHQPFNFFANYAPGTAARKAHLKDEQAFLLGAATGKIPTVSFIKPIGEENEHPGYTSESAGSSHLVDLMNAIFNGPAGDSTLVVVTYDEFGGQWDHMTPPGMTGNPVAHAGGADQWGPGTRIPVLLVSRHFTHSGVDHTQMDTTSIIATLEHKFGLPPIGTRDAAVNDLSTSIALGMKH